MNPGPDREHDPQLAALYRAVADAAPPAHLDDAIRAAARREVAAGPRRAGIRRWAVPVSLAAVVVLSVSVVTMMREQGADRPESMVLPPVETASPAPTDAQREEARPPAIAAPEISKKLEKPAPRRLPAPSLAEPAAPAPAPQAYAPPAAAMEQGALASGSEPRAKVAAEMAREESSAAHRDSVAPQPLLRSVPAPMAADAAGGAGVAAQSAAPARSLLWQDLVGKPPEKWLQRIAELRRAGKTADADVLVAEFRRRFPDEPLPENLR